MSKKCPTCGMSAAPGATDDFAMRWLCGTSEHMPPSKYCEERARHQTTKEKIKSSNCSTSRTHMWGCKPWNCICDNAST